MKLSKFEVDVLFQQFFRPEFTEQPYKKQAEVVLEHLYVYEVDDEIHTNVSEKRRDYLTTIYLRAYCGCEQEPLIDELTGQPIQIELEHGRGCLRTRFPIESDLSVRTLKRRSYKETTLDARGWEILEQRLHG